jgi:5-methylcytosine-specific restriction endonuclease McrA
MSRSVEEWRGKTDDQAIPDRVKLRVWNRSDGKCQICTRKMLAGEIKHYDHIRPLADGGIHAESNLQIACVACHAKKTAGEATDRAKVRAKAKSVLGITRPKQTIKSPGFAKSTPPEKTSTKQQLAYRQLYAPAAGKEERR